MEEIFDSAGKRADFWRQRNVDCSYHTLVKTCISETALYLVYALMVENREDGNVTRIKPTVDNCTQANTNDVIEYLITDSESD